MSELTSQIVFGFLFVIIGFIGGLLVMAAWHARNTGAVPPTAEPEPDPNLEEQVQIFRSKKDNQLVFKLGERTVTARETADPAIKKYLTSLLVDVSSMLGIDRNIAASPNPLTEKESQPKDFLPETDKDMSPLQKISLPFTTRKQESVEVKSDPRSMSIVHQIDAILQEMLQDTDLKNKAIRLDENPAHEVIVWIGVTRYEGIDSIPDPEIKSLIKRAVDRWERQSAEEK
ncbi:MAG TPA: hypothetical protein PLI60_02470 [Anaerolineaceae bacterium]|nr:hypothetical protein [Anaerolineaceae bacterium]